MKNKIPLIDVIESRRALKREDIFLDISSFRACGGTRVFTVLTNFCITLNVQLRSLTRFRT